MLLKHKTPIQTPTISTPINPTIFPFPYPFTTSTTNGNRRDRHIMRPQYLLTILLGQLLYDHHCAHAVDDLLRLNRVEQHRFVVASVVADQLVQFQVVELSFHLCLELDIKG
jgi:hypothetical protein